MQLIQCESCVLVLINNQKRIHWISICALSISGETCNKRWPDQPCTSEALWTEILNVILKAMKGGIQHVTELVTMWNMHEWQMLLSASVLVWIRKVALYIDNILCAWMESPITLCSKQNWIMAIYNNKQTAKNWMCLSVCTYHSSICPISIEVALLLLFYVNSSVYKYCKQSM